MRVFSKLNDIEMDILKLRASVIVRNYHWTEFGDILNLEPYSGLVYYRLLNLEQDFVEAENYEYAAKIVLWYQKHQILETENPIA